MKLANKPSLGTSFGGHLSLSGLCSLCAVVLVVLVVSVPRLGRIALAENESDARSTARFLADSLDALIAASDDAPEDAPEALEWERLLSHPRLRRTLTDAAPAAESPDALAYHGYLFEVVPLPTEWALIGAAGHLLERGQPVPPWAIQARPRHPGASGGSAYLACPRGSTYARSVATPEAELSAWRLVE